MPTNLADLPSDKPIPNGKVQIKRGKVDGGLNTSGLPAGAKLSDGAGGFIEISYTPTYRCYWVVRANVLVVGISGGWTRWDCCVCLSPADDNGDGPPTARSFNAPCKVYDSTTVSWKTFGASATFRLSAGITYTAYLASSYQGAGQQQYHSGPLWTRIIGRVVSEGVR